ncbi:hypothetical protein TRFO_06132 [Tritrichomonas foetus]|uniref:Tectonic-1-3 N-terminal domain-containing protein n=1 Tax=Tritrichomonas foetus TaxID=1144522 RepID=A0A1J4K4S0_9EUKA|nr:hypothetical protein TRFO_06132 [Tritrichomonas foetus]|eukprot:OHT04716.1 hypothetical protein TRFO_06132 [Tritrichomonas foetus]
MLALFFVSSLSLGIQTFIPPVVNESSGIVPDPLNSTFELLPNTDFGNCSCDVSGKCDIYCCCDPDCPTNTAFPFCLDEITNLKNVEPALRMCSDPDFGGKESLIDWFLRTSLCVYRKNDPSPGTFYLLNVNDVTIDELTAVDDQSSLRYIYTTTESTTTNTNNPLPFDDLTAGNIMIPRLSHDGTCVLQYIKYLEPVDEFCDISGISNQCSSTNHFYPPEYIINATTCRNATCIDTTSQCVATQPTYTNNLIRVQVTWGQTPTENSPPHGYRFGQPVTDISGNIIHVSSNCQTDTQIPLLFGNNIEYECDLTTNFTVQPDDLLYFNQSGFVFPVNEFALSPISNNIADNNGTIVHFYPEPLNMSSMLTGIAQVYYVTQTFDIIFKSIGLRSYPQHILTDFQIKYAISKTDVMSTFDIGENKTDTPFVPKLRVYTRFFEAPNDQNIFNSKKNEKLEAWLPF